MPSHFVGLPTKNLPSAKSSELVKISALIFHLKLVPKLHLTGSKSSSYNKRRITARREHISICSAELTALLLEDNQVKKKPATESIYFITSENLLIVIKEQ